MAINQPILTVIVLLSLAVLGLLVRFRPFRSNPALGVDHWYWLLCAEDVKRRRKLPPKLPYFMLEIEEQWYPPLFAGLLALFPMRWLKEYGGKISELTDLLHGFVIFLAVLWVSDSLLMSSLSGLSYLIAWFPLSYNIQLQPRGLANLLLSLAMIGLWFYIDTRLFSIWIGILILSVILLFLHKMTVQMWGVYLLVFGFWSWDWKILFLIPASVFLALVVSRGFYIKMLKAHWDIVSFWHENIRNLGSHQYYESSLYQKEDFVSTAQHQTGWRHQIRKLLSLYKYNAFVLLLPVLASHAVSHDQGESGSFLWMWIGVTCLWTLFTTFVPYFLALGGGHYYLYQTFLPLFLLVGLTIHTMSAWQQGLLFSFWGVGFIFSVVKWETYCRSVVRNKTATMGHDLKDVFDYLRSLPKDGVFCIPFYLPDGAAFWTRKKVFWGGHSYGFQTLLKPYFPIMQKDVKETLKSKPLNYLLFWRGYLSSLKDIGLEEGRDIRFLFGKGEYALYEVVK
jgi:hypothetical protein